MSCAGALFEQIFTPGAEMGKPAPKAPAECVALYDALVATNPQIERKGATMPYTSVNGNMFSLLTPDGTLALRLSTADREAFLKRHNTALCEQYGSVMKEYVRVPHDLLRNTMALAKYLDLSYHYACSLKAKPTTKKTTAKKAKAARGKRGAG
jgi:TfoX/Sxy family transcriptional regulator of competence genes